MYVDCGDVAIIDLGEFTSKNRYRIEGEIEVGCPAGHLWG
jgi:hypothetical protein